MSADVRPHLVPGNWVLCWGQVVAGATHPEDVVVEFFSHNEQFAAHLRRDRVEDADVPDFALQCTALHEDDEANKFIRCELSDAYPGNHRRGEDDWHDLAVDGHIEATS